MTAQNSFTEQSYRVSQWILMLLTFAAFTIVININPPVSRYLFGLPVIISGALGIYGSVYVLKGLHEPASEKKVIAITVNFAMVVLMAIILLSNTLF